MKTLIGATEPERQPGLTVTYNPQSSTVTSTTAIVWWPVVDVISAQGRNAIRTTAYVGKPVPEIEAQ